jgi:hypothetical protein
MVRKRHRAMRRLRSNMLEVDAVNVQNRGRWHRWRGKEKRARIRLQRTRRSCMPGIFVSQQQGNVEFVPAMWCREEESPNTLEYETEFLADMTRGSPYERRGTRLPNSILAFSIPAFPQPCYGNRTRQWGVVTESHTQDEGSVD